MENFSSMFHKQKKKKNKRLVSRLIEGWVFTTVYRLQESAWNNAWPQQNFQFLP